MELSKSLGGINLNTLFFIIFLLSLPTIFYFVVRVIISSVKKDTAVRGKQLKSTGITSVVMLVSLIVFISTAETTPVNKNESEKIETSAPAVKEEPKKEAELTEVEKEELAKKEAEEKEAAELKAKEAAEAKAKAEIEKKAKAEAKAKEESIPREHKSALKSAESYAKTMHMSKAGIYEQLTSEYGEGFPAEAAQYAIDNIVFDWKENALKTAQTYAETMNMSDSGIYDQLISEYGEKFTAEEAQYAIDNLE